MRSSSDLLVPSTDRIVGAVSIVAGTAVGAAMLALPIVMGRAGFLPSVVAFVGAWIFMAYSALLFVELAVTHRKGSNVIFLAQETLGKFGALGASIAYVLLLYALLTAYIAGVSQIIASVMDSMAPSYVSQEMVCVIFFIISSWLFLKGIALVDNINRILLVGLIASFLLLIGSSGSHFEKEALYEMRWQYIVPSLSIGFTAFGFHVVIPSVANYLNYHSRTLVRVVLLGSFIPLVIYIVWQAVCLFQIPMTGGPLSIDGAYLRGVSGAELLSQIYQNSMIRFFADMFAVTAIITSFIGVALSMVDFAREGLYKAFRLPIHRSWTKYLVLSVAFIPPTWFSLSSPTVFFTALEVAGVFGVVLLLAFFPALMVYCQRYRKSVENPENGYKAPGGKKIILGYMVLCLLLVVLEAVKIGS